MTINLANGIGRSLKQEDVPRISTFPVCRLNNALGRDGAAMPMMRDDRYAVAVADASSRITGGSRIGVYTLPPGCGAPILCRAHGDLMHVLELRDSFETHGSGNTRDQLSTVFDKSAE